MPDGTLEATELLSLSPYDRIPQSAGVVVKAGKLYVTTEPTFAFDGYTTVLLIDWSS